MADQTIWVPHAVLNNAAQSSHARLVWVLLHLSAQGDPGELPDKQLSDLSGLCLKTIVRIRAGLAQEPLPPCYTSPHPSCAAMPVQLLTATELTVGARLLYGQLQGVPGFARQKGSFTYSALSRLTGSCDDALRRAVAELVANGWLTISQENRKSPVEFTLRNPVGVRARARIASLRRKVRQAQFRGETILREFLNLLVALDVYEENAAPEFLLNPFTKELMELDRYYPGARVGFEFQGAQHFDVTDLADFEATAKQVGRDAMKAFICKGRGIELVTVTPEELSRKAIEAKIPKGLPRRNLSGREALLAALDEQASEYRERDAQERARKRAHSFSD